MSLKTVLKLTESHMPNYKCLFIAWNKKKKPLATVDRCLYKNSEEGEWILQQTGVSTKVAVAYKDSPYT